MKTGKPSIIVYDRKETFYSSTLDKCIEKGREMIGWNENNAVGVNIRTLPITPEKVFMAMKNK